MEIKLINKKDKITFNFELLENNAWYINKFIDCGVEEIFGEIDSLGIKRGKF